MKSKERISTILDLGEPDRIGMHDEFWLETIRRWKREGGLPPDAPEPIEGCEYKHIAPKYFDMDMVFVEIDVSPRFERKVIKKEEKSMIISDEWGQIRRSWLSLKDGAPQVLDNIIKSEEDWEKVEDRFQPTPDRIVDPPYEKLKEMRKSEKFVTLLIFNPWEWGWRLVGFTNLIKLMYKKPSFVKRMFDKLREFQTELMKMAIEEAWVDGVWMWGDSAYNSGPFLSLKMYEEFISPYHAHFCNVARKYGLHVILHTDGDVRPLIPYFIKEGIRGLNPIESDLLDIGELKEKYGDKLVFVGGIDVKKLAKGPEKAREEVIDKIKKAAYGGGFIFHSDHSVPPDVSFEAYKAALDAALKYGRYRP